MKPIFLSFIVLPLLLNDGLAQQTSPKAITKKVGEKVEKRNEQTRSALGEGQPARPPAPNRPPSSSPSSPTSPPSAPATRPAAPVAREKSKEEKDAILKKTIDFQKQRALSGQASAQYDYGMRFLNGDGVEKNLDEGRKWIEKAAQQSHSLAVKKLEELNKNQ